MAMDERIIPYESDFGKAITALKTLQSLNKRGVLISKDSLLDCAGGMIKAIGKEKFKAKGCTLADGKAIVVFDLRGDTVSVSVRGLPEEHPVEIGPYDYTETVAQLSVEVDQDSKAKSLEVSAPNTEGVNPNLGVGDIDGQAIALNLMEMLGFASGYSVVKRQD